MEYIFRVVYLSNVQCLFCNIKSYTIYAHDHVYAHKHDFSLNCSICIPKCRDAKVLYN